MPSPLTKFTGKERDTESNLDYFVARCYSSAQGRFLSPDEFTGGPVNAFSSNDPLPPGPLPYADITNPQSLNKYAYTHNNPLRYTDPTGHCTTVLTYPICQGPRIGSLGGPKGAAIGAIVGLGVGVTIVYLASRSPNLEQVRTDAAGALDLARETGDRLAKALGEGGISGAGAKGSAEAERHLDAVRDFGRQLDQLMDKLGRATGKKEREKLAKEIIKVVDKIKGHIKEIKQKWGDKLQNTDKPK